MAGNRWQLGVCLLGLAGWLVGQEPHHAGQHRPTGPTGAPSAAASKRGTELPPTHKPQPESSPYELLTYLRTAADQAAAQRAGYAQREGKPATSPSERPAGAGRYLAAVITCADADLDAVAAFGVPRRDLLVVATAGGLVDGDTVALLESLAGEQRLGLIVLLGHDDCTSRRVGITTRARRQLAERLTAVGCGAATPAAATLALLAAQRESMLAASSELDALATQDRLRIVPARLDGTGNVHWLSSPAAELPIAPVK